MELRKNQIPSNSIFFVFKSNIADDEEKSVLLQCRDQFYDFVSAIETFLDNRYQSSLYGFLRYLIAPESDDTTAQCECLLSSMGAARTAWLFATAAGFGVAPVAPAGVAPYRVQAPVAAAPAQATPPSARRFVEVGQRDISGGARPCSLPRVRCLELIAHN